MKRALSLVLVVCFLTAFAFAQQPLSIRRILLYKNGMAYVVRAGQINSPLSLTFRPDEMNDVLKSFTAWNPDTAALYTVGYTAGIATGHLLQKFSFDLRTDDDGLPSFLKQIKALD